MWHKLIFWFPAQQRLLFKLPSHSAALRYSPPRPQEHTDGALTYQWILTNASDSLFTCPTIYRTCFFSIFGSEPFAVPPLPSPLNCSNQKTPCMLPLWLSFLFHSLFIFVIYNFLLAFNRSFISAIWHFPQAFWNIYIYMPLYIIALVYYCL